MANPRLIIATGLAGLAFALAIFGMIGSSMLAGTSGHGSMAASHFGGLSGSHIPGLIALASSIAAFVISWRHRSFIVAGLLIAAGILYSMHLGPFLGDHGAIPLYGPIIGVLSGHLMLALGVVKAIGSLRTPVAKTAS
jgi:hypothetical protein